MFYIRSMRDIQSREDIQKLIDAFYEKLLQSDIGYIFTDVAKIDLEHHLPILYKFWENLLLYSSDYRGNPMEVHLQLHKKTPLTKADFDTWLTLFDATADELFEGPKTEEAKQKARNIAGLMRYNIEKAEQRW